ncbi:iodothyronine deiodinase [Rhizophagus irregularis DAOM 181602=DAOM 197198]|nr:iodothyronine deiodinase [Rhizophagus irregularis DAOM 181602=DAOM 197198]
MYLISVPNLPPVFSVTIGPHYYKANVTADTMVELLLKCFKTYIKDEIHDYNLNYCGKVLQNTDTLKNLGIKEGDFISAVQIPFKLYVKTQDGKAIELLLMQNNTIHEIKRMVQERSTLELILTTIKLYVKTQDEKAIELYLTENNTIHDVKEMVQKCIDIPVHRQCFLFGGKQLDDSSTMKCCNIQNESTLVLTTTSFKLCVKTQDGQIVEIYVTEYNTIREVKQMIQKCEGIPINKQCLYSLLYRKQLSDSNTLKYYGIREGATLELLLAIIVRVKTLSGKILTLSICDNSSIFPRESWNEPTLHLVLRLRGGMFDETSGRVDFNALPSLMQYMHVPERHLVHDKVHAGIACNYCGKSEWKGARYKCSECFDYDLCDDCIKMSKLLHDVQHNFSELLDPENQNDFPKVVPVNPVTIVPILPTKKEEMLNLLQEEEKRRVSPELQQKYYEVGSDPTSGKDWMDVTDQMQHELVREFGYSDEAVELLRRAPQLYKDDPAFQTTQVYVRNNIASIGNLKEGMPAPDCSLVPLNNDKTITQLRSLYQPGRPLVLLAGSHTCPLYRYISHVLNDIYKKYRKDVDFYMIQIREAHASDVWPIGNIVNVKEHRTLEERLTAARNMVEATHLKISVLADTMDNTFLKLYSPWPFRFFVIMDGNFKLVGMPKEARYDTTDLVNCLDALLDEKSPESKPDTPLHKKRRI